MICLVRALIKCQQLCVELKNLCLRSQAEALRSQRPKKMGSVRSKTLRTCSYMAPVSAARPVFDELPVPGQQRL